MLTVLCESLNSCVLRCIRIKLSLFLWLIFNQLAVAQFTPATGGWSVEHVNVGSAVFGTGVSIHDFDGDGLDDLSFGTINEPPRFYRNTGDGFEPYEFQHPSPTLPVKSILWADIDNDGDKDLLLTYENGPIRIYENIGDMQLVDITASSGITIETGLRYTGASFGDYNNDGYLDLYVCKFYNSNMFSGTQYENKLYRNNGDNTFTDVTYEANASVGVNASFMASWFDYNGDGWQDLFIVNDRIFNQNYLLHNNGDGTFTDVSELTGVNHFIDAMGFSPGDYNNDLLIDFFVANTQFMGNYLYQHQPDHTFLNVAEEAGVEAFELCWSGLWMDHNNNGWQDLHVGVELTVFGQNSPNLFFVNNGDGTLTESAQSLGLANDHHSTFATAHGDWNNDGYPDFVTSNSAPNPSLLWQNTGGSNNYLAVTLEGQITNRDAIGSHIYCYASGSSQMRYTLCGENYLGQNSQRKIFGIGSNEQVDSLVVKWLSGHTDTFYNLEANQTYHFVEGQSISASITSDYNDLCASPEIELSATFGEQIVWNTGEENTPTITVDQPGSYWYTAQTSQGIVFTSDTLFIDHYSLPTLSVQTTAPSCAGLSDGQVELFVSGDLSDLWVTFDDLPAGWLIENLSPGVYTIELGHALGCSQSYSVAIPETAELQALAIPGEVLCFGESTHVEWFVFGEQGNVEVEWGDFNPDALQAGEYSFFVSDEHQCVTTLNFSISQPPLLEADIAIYGSELVASVSGGTPPYQYRWYMNETLVGSDSSLTIDQFESYLLEVEDSHGCTAFSTLDVVMNIKNDHLINQNVLYPNPAQQVIYYKGQCLSEQMSIYNMGGQLVKSQRCNYSHSETAIDLTGLSNGMYHLVFDRHREASFRFLINE